MSLIRWLRDWLRPAPASKPMTVIAKYGAAHVWQDYASGRYAVVVCGASCVTLDSCYPGDEDGLIRALLRADTLAARGAVASTYG